jgi:adenine-specific DNA-methyltransferase
MELNALKPRQSLNKAFLKLKPNRTDIEEFKTNLIELIDRSNPNESEEFHKNLITEFLRKTYYRQSENFINTKGRSDLVIYNGKDSKSTVGVIIEAKKTSNKSEMPSLENINVKAFHELILYYLRERITEKNLDIKHIIATNINEWFVFEANIFEKLFVGNKNFVKQFTDFEEGRLSGKNTDFFYSEIAKPFVESIKSEICFTYFDLRDYEKPLRNDDKKDDTKLVALFKLFSPEHLLKLPFANDSNSLDKRFYSELLHIIGLTESKQGSKKLIERKHENERDYGSILENAIIQLDSLDKISRLENPGQYGATTQERLFAVGLELAITWINRILFLKLLEAQLIKYHKGNKEYAFLNLDRIHNYDDLNTLFFQVLAKRYEDRNLKVKDLYSKVPFLNSSLFEPNDLEHLTLFISNLSDDDKIPILSSTVLKDNTGKKRTGELTTLEYLFEFLDSYDFSSEGAEDIQEDNKTLINASVLGLIFEKINGYKDGSFFTPGFITMYMCRETLRRAVLQKFNETKDWNCENLNDIFNKDIELAEANQIVNSIKICDPAVGSGHFLVSALNEIISVKSDLKILTDREGKRLKFYNIEVVNDELIVTDEDGELFEYNPSSKESQRVQETLFHEKQTIIENCLFGVDINPNSVKICRLRLWIELLKNAYYKNETELETLPNIDINIKCGNSLVSRFSLDSDLKKALKQSKWSIDMYRIAVQTYRNAENKEQKHEMEKLIKTIKTDFRSEIAANSKEINDLSKWKGELYDLMNQTSLFEKSAKEKKEFDKKAKSLAEKIKKQEALIEEIKNNKIYENAFEWRFEFPEVLDDDGEFVGFDVVIGNPPYIKEYEGKEIFDGLRGNEVYQGKMDVWYMFAADGIKLLKYKGLLCFIAPNNWVTNAGASKFRNFVLENVQINELLDFSNYMVFDTASIQTMIMSFIKTKQKTKYTFELRQIITKNPILDDALDLLNEKRTKNNQIFKPIIEIKDFIDKFLVFNNPVIGNVCNKILNSGNYFLKNNEVANGIHPHYDFISKSINAKHNNIFKNGEGIFGLSHKGKENLNLLPVELELIKPYFTTEQFFRYFSIKENKLWIIYTNSSFKNPNSMDNYPNLKTHLDRFKDVITSDNKPYGLHRTREERFFKGEKIIVQRKCVNRPIFTYTDYDTYVSATFYVIKTENINQKYLTGLLNSKLIEFWLRYKGKMQGNNFQLDKEPLINIPIINPKSVVEDKIANIVDEIIQTKQENTNADISPLESEIDRLVYELYGLSEEEIKVVESSIE